MVVLAAAADVISGKLILPICRRRFNSCPPTPRGRRAQTNPRRAIQFPCGENADGGDVDANTFAIDALGTMRPICCYAALSYFPSVISSFETLFDPIFIQYIIISRLSGFVDWSLLTSK
jgi:hypothetical protein